MLYIINKTIDYMHQICFLYMLNYLVIYLLSVRKSSSKHARNCVYLIKIENSFYYLKLLSHAMPEHVAELSSLVRKQQQQLSFTGHVDLVFFPLVFKSAAVSEFVIPPVVFLILSLSLSHIFTRHAMPSICYQFIHWRGRRNLT